MLYVFRVACHVLGLRSKQSKQDFFLVSGTLTAAEAAGIVEAAEVAGTAAAAAAAAAGVAEGTGFHCWRGLDVLDCLYDVTIVCCVTFLCHKSVLQYCRGTHFAYWYE